MKDYAEELWRRACKALDTARRDLDSDPDASASRAYYASFYAASAVLALEDKDFKTHAAVEAAVHRDLVKPGQWSVDLGASYRDLRRLRATGDYGGLEHVEEEDARRAVEQASAILDAVRADHPELEIQSE